MASRDRPRLCRICLRKEPPIEVELIVGTNITEQRFNRSDFTCNDCQSELQRDYRAGGKTRYSEYLQNQHDELVEELTQQWEDPAYRKSRMAERIYKVWDKYGRRWPDKGIRKAWILEVIMRDLWFIDANAIIEDFFENNNWPRSKRVAAKQYLLQFVALNLEFLQEPFRRVAEIRWDGIVDTINREHEGVDKMVARPQWEDPVTKERIDNWFLLSRTQEFEWREKMREEKKARSDMINDEERLMVEMREAEVTRETTETETKRDSNKGENEKSNGGESKE